MGSNEENAVPKINLGPKKMFKIKKKNDDSLFSFAPPKDIDMSHINENNGQLSFYQDAEANFQSSKHTNKTHTEDNESSVVRKLNQKKQYSLMKIIKEQMKDGQAELK